MSIPIRLLLIEDSATDSQLILHELKRAGYEASYKRVETADEMRAALAEADWDAITSDYRMPEFSGPEALALIKESGQDIPFIIVSGTVGEVSAVEAMKAGAHDYVMKDNLTRLGPAIAREIEEAQVRRERAKAEAAHRESEERFSAMADSAPVLLWMTDEAGKCTYVNLPMLHFYDCSLDQLAGKPWLESIHPDDVKHALKMYRIAAEARSPFEMELRLRRHDGEWRWMLGTAIPRMQSDGAFLGYIGTFTDLTERKRAEIERENIRRQNERLLREKAANAVKQRAFFKDVLLSVTEGKLHLCDNANELPFLPGPPMQSLPISSATLREVRKKAEALALESGLPPERCNDLVTSVGEAAMNAVVHAGSGVARIYADSERVQIWIEDQGRGIDIDSLPRATLERGYTTANSLGHGFFMILSCTDRVYLLTGAMGTTVVLEQFVTAPQPVWLN